MKHVIAPKPIGDLLKLLSGLASLHEELLTLIRAKIDAMRQADINSMRELAGQEQGIAGRIHEREGFRRQLMDVVGEKLGLPPRAARALSVSQLADRLPESQGEPLLGAADRLRERVSRVAAANRVAGAIAREIVSHLQWVFASVRTREDGPVGYSGEGALVARPETKILDAFG